MELILASTSPYRRALLERFGLPFRAVAPDVDEVPVQQGSLPPDQVAQTLARLKAENVAAMFPAAVVIGSDQLVDFEGTILGKPGNFETARKQLRQMSGRTHRLITAVTVIAPNQTIHFEDLTTLTLRQIADEEIDRYLQADQPWDCAGSIRIESLGITLFETIDSPDHTAIIGLPLMQLASALRQMGFRLP